MADQVRLHRIVARPVTLHFSPGYGARAKRLGALIEEAHHFLAGWLGVSGPITLTVLRRVNWQRLRRAPYGYPHSNPAQQTIFAPAHYPPRLVSRLHDLYQAAPPPLQAALCEGEGALEAQIHQFYDLVAVHELGHLFIDQLQLALGTRWLTELVANWLATAFFVAARPDLARCWLAWADLQASQSVPHRSLAAFETHYPRLSFANAAYYQGRFNQEAHRLWQSQGRALAAPLVARFSLAPEAIAARLAPLVPDFFAAWPPAEPPQ